MLLPIQIIPKMVQIHIVKPEGFSYVNLNSDNSPVILPKHPHKTNYYTKVTWTSGSGISSYIKSYAYSYKVNAKNRP